MNALTEALGPWIPLAAGLAALLAAALIGDLVVRRVAVALARVLAGRAKEAWARVMISHRVFSRFGHIIPGLVLVGGARLVPDLPAGALTVIENVGMAYVVLMVVMAVGAALSAGNEIYETYPASRTRPLKGVVQVVQLIVYLIGAVLIISMLIDRSPLLLLSGFGAMTAVLLLVFKDTILGFVASVQLTANDMVRVGDWIEMPAYGADGDVIDVALHTVRVQNFDKTVTTIPTYKLIQESFRNWRGMTDSGGRRIKRSLLIDQSSVRFLTESEIDRLRSFSLLREHIATKLEELGEHREALGEDAESAVNRRRLTNVGVFRAYIRQYLRHNPNVHEGMTLLVRQLPPGPEGLPIEVYCFTRTTDWGEYEDHQSDIFDHMIAIVPEFGLRIFQRPAGSDLTGISLGGAQTPDEPADREAAATAAEETE